jgi:hypothetical protein
MKGHLTRTVLFVFAVVVVLPMLLVVMGTDGVALAVFIALPLIAVISAGVLVRAARAGRSIPLLSYIAAMLVILALGAAVIGGLAAATVAGIDIDGELADILIFSVILAVTGVPGPVFLLLYRTGYFGLPQ